MRLLHLLSFKGNLDVFEFFMEENNIKEVPETMVVNSFISCNFEVTRFLLKLVNPQNIIDSLNKMPTSNY